MASVYASWGDWYPTVSRWQDFSRGNAWENGGFDLTPDEALLDGMYAEACASLPALDAETKRVRLRNSRILDFLPFWESSGNF